MTISDGTGLPFLRSTGRLTVLSRTEALRLAMAGPRHHVTRTLALCCAVLVVIAGRADAEPAATSRLRWVTNGSVHAATISGQTLFIGGSFTRVAPAQNLLGLWLPDEMREEYTTPGVERVTGVATYSRYRRADVSVRVLPGQ
jgi:hypothetical protein